MRAVLDRDIIVHLTPHGDTEIGRIPPGVGLERLRFASTIKAKLTEYYASKQNITERI